MVEYIKINAKLLDSQLNKLKCEIDAEIQKKIHVSGTTILKILIFIRLTLGICNVPWRL